LVVDDGKQTWSVGMAFGFVWAWFPGALIGTWFALKKWYQA
jgi:hypothetical protein